MYVYMAYKIYIVYNFDKKCTYEKTDREEEMQKFCIKIKYTFWQSNIFSKCNYVTKK